MARSHARIYTSIWSDADFILLPPDAQRMFLFLVSQPDLEHSGVIALRERRWSRASAGLTPADVAKALEVLDAARFVVYDEDTEELLVRSLMRWDGVWKQPNVAKSAAAQIRTVASDLLRAELRLELERLGASDVHHDSLELRAGLLGDLKGCPEPELASDPESPSATPSVTPSATPSGGTGESPSLGGQGKGSTSSTTGDSPSPAPALFPTPGPVPPPAGAKTARRRLPAAEIAERQRHVGEVVAAFVDGATGHGLHSPAAPLKSRVGKQARVLLAEDWPIDFLIESARRMGAGEFNDLAVQVRKDEVAAKGAAGGGAPAPKGQQATDAMFDRAMQRAREREERQRDA